MAKSNTDEVIRSKLDSSVLYPEEYTLDKDDRGYDAPIFGTVILNQYCTIAVGKSKDVFIKKGIIYYPIYLVKDDKISLQIGLYEILSSTVNDVLDEDGDLDLAKIGSPLLYSFVEPNLLESDKKVHDDEEDDEEADEEDDEEEADEEDDEEANEEDDDEDDDEEANEEDDDEEGDEEEGDEEEGDDEEGDEEEGDDEEGEEAQSARDDALEHEDFSPNVDLPWIQNYLESKYYDIIDNEGGGDCLFCVIRDGLDSVGKQVSVESQRAIVAENTDVEVFNNYRVMYETTLVEVEELTAEVKKYAKQHRELQQRKRTIKDRTIEKRLVSEGERIAKLHKKTKEDLLMAKDLHQDYKFMEGIDTFEAFKALLQTKGFWGDATAITTLERELNVKLVIFSSKHFEDEDFEGVLQCGELDEQLETQGYFNPEFYILLDYTGDHYKLITYKNNGAFTFKRMPYAIKKLITKKCLERMSGPYALIPEVVSFYKSIHGGGPEKPICSPHNDLYNGQTVFQYYDKSYNKPLPGKGSGERIHLNDVVNYLDLQKFVNWRRMLSNHWEAEFHLDGKCWLSVTHYYEASKYKHTHPKFYNLFSLNSNSKLSKYPEMAQAAGSLSGLYKVKDKPTKRLRPMNIKMDSDFYNTDRSVRVKKAALRAKFTQHDTLRKVLLATKNAKLLQYKTYEEPRVSNELMCIRKELELEQKS